MDAPLIAAFASAAAAFGAILVLVGPVFLRLGRVEGEVKATRERSDEQYREARERSEERYKYLRERMDDQFKQAIEHTDAQFKRAREHSDAQYSELREWAGAQFNEARERSEAQHAETLSEIRRLTDAFLSHSHAPDGGVSFRVPPPADEGHRDSGSTG